MKDYLIHDDWKIIEDKWRPDFNEISESIFSIGNGKMGQRATFEETYSGKTMQGSYIGGVYYPDKTKVGWWKNGYPEYFAKVLNSVNWIGIDVEIDGQLLDLNECDVTSFRRTLDMKEGILSREVGFTTKSGNSFVLTSERFCSMSQTRIGAIKYSLKSENFSGKIKLNSYLDFDVTNKDSNYDENFWTAHNVDLLGNYNYVQASTKKTDFTVYAAAYNSLEQIEGQANSPELSKDNERKSFSSYALDLDKGQSFTLYKLVSICSSLDVAAADQKQDAKDQLDKAVSKGYDQLRADHIASWDRKWQLADISISGDVAAQQGIRFNIFHLLQTYTGEDNRLNIGPKGFTGEKYGGSTYWDTEAYCIPFYLGTTDSSVARNLLVYRHNQLPQAIENAEKLGFTCGAALYPMVTMNGEECHNEWEITFEEIHRNGAIAYAIYDYINYTEDAQYLAEYGLEVLIAISRFWSQRIHLSKKRDQYVMLGVTGPNEYENNVNNNWYTNYIACWTLRYTMEAIDHVKNKYPKDYDRIIKIADFDEGEMDRWSDINEKMYYPKDAELDIVLQQDNYLDKEQILVSELEDKHLPLNQNWSWDRILRSCFIKQADVLQGFYFFEDDFDLEAHRKNFEFYEPRTVHESSLSPCIHSILACKLGMKEKAYEMYLRTSRLDLNDYNNDTEDGLHITSMAGTWLSIVKGFAGLRIKEGSIHLTPSLPDDWDSIAFKIRFKESLISVLITKSGCNTEILEGKNINIVIH